MRAIFVAVALIIPGHLDLPPEIDVAAVASTTAERLDPPTTLEAAPTLPGSSASSGGRCIGWEALLARESPGWDVIRMSRIAYRESRCLPGARNSSSTATGLLQILASHCGWLAHQMSTWCTRARLTDPEFNIRSAAELWRNGGYQHWSTS